MVKRILWPFSFFLVCLLVVLFFKNKEETQEKNNQDHLKYKASFLFLQEEETSQDQLQEMKWGSHQLKRDPQLQTWMFFPSQKKMKTSRLQVIWQILESIEVDQILHSKDLPVVFHPKQTWEFIFRKLRLVYEVGPLHPYGDRFYMRVTMERFPMAKMEGVEESEMKKKIIGKQVTLLLVHRRVPIDPHTGQSEIYDEKNPLSLVLYQELIQHFLHPESFYTEESILGGQRR